MERQRESISACLNALRTGSILPVRQLALATPSLQPSPNGPFATSSTVPRVPLHPTTPGLATRLDLEPDSPEPHRLPDVLSARSHLLNLAAEGWLHLGEFKEWLEFNTATGACVDGRHIRELEGAVDAFTLAAAAPPTSDGASLFNNFCYIRGRCLTLWDTLYEDIYAAEYLASRPVAHSPHWPFQRFISYSEDPSRAYADLIVNAALASRLQTAEGVLARSWHHASAIWHGSNARAPSPPRGAFYRRRPQEDGALRSAS